jgi:hypothetical protein
MAKNYFLFYILFLLGVCTSISSCSLFNPPEIIPCYGHIDSIPLIIPNPSVQGTASNGINCAWVYVDDNPVGAFQLPSTFPAIAVTGKHSVQIFAGISENGTASTRLKYPFYTPYSVTNVQLTQGAVTKFKLSTEYASWTDFALMENFESDFSGVTAFTTNTSIGATDTTMFPINKTTHPNDVYEGLASGEVDLTGTLTNWQYTGCTDTIKLLNNGNAVFMELNYKSNCVFEVGLYAPFIGGTGTSYPVIYIDTSSTWKKMYINLQPTIGAASPNPNFAFFNIFIYMTTAQGVPAQLYLDNIKVLRYK